MSYQVDKENNELGRKSVKRAGLFILQVLSFLIAFVIILLYSKDQNNQNELLELEKKYNYLESVYKDALVLFGNDSPIESDDADGLVAEIEKVLGELRTGKKLMNTNQKESELLLDSLIKINLGFSQKYPQIFSDLNSKQIIKNDFASKKYINEKISELRIASNQQYQRMQLQLEQISAGYDYKKDSLTINAQMIMDIHAYYSQWLLVDSARYSAHFISDAEMLKRIDNIKQKQDSLAKSDEPKSVKKSYK